MTEIDIDKLWENYCSEHTGQISPEYLKYSRTIFKAGAQEALKSIKIFFVDNDLSRATLSSAVAQNKFKDYKIVPLCKS